jgi:hypothetical protein
MGNQPSKEYIKTWSEDFKKGWGEGYTTALDEIHNFISRLIDQHYTDEV